MRHPKPRAAFTLLELILALVIVGILAGIALPLVGDTLDRLAVRRAADALALAIARTRAEAVAQGGAALVIRIDAATFFVEGDEGARAAHAIDLGNRYAVELESSGVATGRVRLRFDALGIGRMASRTIRITRGEAEARVVVSSYGRVRVQ